MTALPGIVADDDGHVHTLVIAEPCFLYAWHTTELDSGRSWLSIYRSVALRADDELCQPAHDLIGNTGLLRCETVEDQNMLFCEAELSVYAA